MRSLPAVTGFSETLGVPAHLCRTVGAARCCSLRPVATTTWPCPSGNIRSA
jgi:hypothetical protein